MFSPRVRTAILSAVGCIALGGCASYYNPYGGGYGYGARYGYGYGGLSVGYGNGYYGNGYYSPSYGGYYSPGYYGYRSYPTYGWYNGFYYPGRGIYVYDRHNRPHRWSQSQRRYWQQRHSQWQQRNRPQTRQVVVRERRDGWRDDRRDGRRDGRRNGRRDDD